MANAYPTNLLIEPNDPDWKRALGFKAPYRTPQTVDLITSLSRFDSSIPVLFNAGNHDLSEDPERYQLDAFQRVWGDTYFNFWAHGRFFIALETQFFRSAHPETIDHMLEEIHWLEELFSTMPKDIPKTVMMHAPLFIDNVLETDSDQGKSPGYTAETLQQSSTDTDSGMDKVVTSNTCSDMRIRTRMSAEL